MQGHLEKARKLSSARNTDRVISYGKRRVEEWEETPDLDFTKNLVFIDEVEFNLLT